MARSDRSRSASSSRGGRRGRSRSGARIPARRSHSRSASRDDRRKDALRRDNRSKSTSRSRGRSPVRHRRRDNRSRSASRSGSRSKANDNDKGKSAARRRDSRSKSASRNRSASRSVSRDKAPVGRTSRSRSASRSSKTKRASRRSCSRSRSRRASVNASRNDDKQLRRRASRSRSRSASAKRKSRSRSRSASNDRAQQPRKRSRRDDSASPAAETARKKTKSKTKKSAKSKTTKKSSRRRQRSPSSSSSSSEDDERTKRKQRKRAEKVLASLGYSNETNPFGDSNLSQPFVWGKKYAAVSASGSGKPSEKELKAQQLARMDEIQKARKRRDEREAEREEMERLKNEELRLRDAEQYDDWQAKEESFHLNQARVRSTLRIKERREKPVDVLAKNLILVAQLTGKHEKDEALFRRATSSDTSSSGAIVRVERRRPHAIVEVLAMDELEELRDNITAYLDLESADGDGENKEFWTLMMLICCDRIERLRRTQSEGIATTGAIHSAVNDTITDMLRGKDKAELQTLKRDVAATIASAATTTGVDVAFWDEVTQQIDVYLARLRLGELHDEMLEKLREWIDKYESTSTSVSASASAGAVDGRDESDAAVQMERAEARKELESMEEKMDASEEVALDRTAAAARPAWSDKYEPRKPRYFNRVKTGYDWNKYNQTHYDHDNPPPKVVQGYKFNLFYPDLIDRHTAPRFVLEQTQSSDFCIIRFSAGPPYEDIAFKIVNREWEYSRKRGFKSVFERGILHLYFNFKRHRYRR